MSVATARNQEPTMEDILASIRKIISDDLEGGAARPSDNEPSNPADVYDLADQMAFHAQKEAALLSPLGTDNDPAEGGAQTSEAQHIVTDPVAVVTELAARMRSAVEAAALVGPAGEGGHQQGVAGGGNGKEFGDALDERQHDDLEDEHGLATLGSCGRDRIFLPRRARASYTRATSGANAALFRLVPMSCQEQG